MTRPVIYDATEAIDHPARADAADRHLARRLAAEPSDRFHLARMGSRGLSALSPAQARERLLGGHRSHAFDAARAWLLGAGAPSPSTAARPKARAPRFGLSWSRPNAADAPRGAIFLKVGLRGWDNPRLEAWLETRPDLTVVAALREPWQLDFPEYVSAAEAEACARGWAAIGRRASAVVALNEAARARKPDGPLLSPPSDLAGTRPAALDPALAETPFLIQAGPIEARANCLLMLQIWRELARGGGAPAPKLILVGERGAQTNEIAPMLDWAEVIRPHVYETGRLDGDSIRQLVAHARALVAPDFAAPDSALLRDARALGVKVIASDIPAFRNLEGEGVVRLDPLCGPDWRDAILAAARTAPRRAPDFARLPDWTGWTADLFAFLDAL